jgi:hypothetical protein
MNNAISPSPEFAGLEFSLTTRKMQPKDDTSADSGSTEHHSNGSTK